MVLKPVQGELNVVLKLLFAHIPQAHLIHDDLIAAAKTQDEHDSAILQVMQAIQNAGLTLNPEKCHFGEQAIDFWGLIIGRDGVKPNPAKVEALEHIHPPNNKEKLISFLCMMQSNADFIPNFSLNGTQPTRLSLTT